MDEYGEQAREESDRSRVLTAALVEVATRLEISTAELSPMIEASPEMVLQIQRHGRGIDEGSKTWERAVLVVRMYRSLFALVGGQDADARAWFDNPVASLDGQRPRDMLRHAEGLTRVCDYLDACQVRG